MRIVEVKALENGAHRNQTGTFEQIPEGWAVVPEMITLPESFPFVNVVAEHGIVTQMTAGDKPEIPDEPPEPTDRERIEALEGALLEIMTGGITNG